MPSHPALSALLQAPRTIVAPQVGAEALDRVGRRAFGAAYGVEPSLVVLAKLHAAIDFSNLDGTRQTVERLWLGGIDDLSQAASNLSWATARLFSQPEH